MKVEGCHFRVEGYTWQSERGRLARLARRARLPRRRHKGRPVWPSGGRALACPRRRSRAPLGPAADLIRANLGRPAAECGRRTRARRLLPAAELAADPFAGRPSGAASCPLEGSLALSCGRPHAASGRIPPDAPPPGAQSEPPAAISGRALPVGTRGRRVQQADAQTGSPVWPEAGESESEPFPMIGGRSE